MENHNGEHNLPDSFRCVDGDAPRKFPFRFSARRWRFLQPYRSCFAWPSASSPPNGGSIGRGCSSTSGSPASTFGAWCSARLKASSSGAMRARCLEPFNVISRG
ncbi:hypothetical protein RPHASCH2410_PB01775 (plasmid) [Rhizobium phaseoli Ch24-10]|nr:hypothetical protein RPHASCH2410_PB01775 [Rhizobium phaseoli Ch24-10]